MANVAAWIKEHKTATAGIAAGSVLLFILLRRGSGGSSTSGSATPLQIAQLQSAQNLQMAQIQAQQNERTTSAQVAIEESNAQLQAEQNKEAVALALNLNQTGTQAKLQQETLAYYENLAKSRNALVSSSLPQITELEKRGGKANVQAAIDELALLLNEPQGISFSSFGPPQPNSLLLG